MTNRVVKAEESDLPEIDIPDVHLIITKTGGKPDPFTKSIKDIKGLSTNNKKRATRKVNELKKTYKGTDGTGTKQIEIEATGYAFLDVVQPPYNLDNLAKLPEISAPHGAAIRAKVANVVGLGWKFVESPKMKRKLDKIDSEEKTARARQRLDQARDELVEFIDDLNDDDSLVETLSKAYYDYEALGVGYIEIGRNKAGKISYIGHIPGTTIRVRRERDGYVQIVSNKAVFFRNFATDTADPIGGDGNPNEIIMFKKYSAKNSFYGLPDIISAATAVAGNEFANRFNIEFFENKAMPRYIIVLKGAELSAASQTKIAQFFEVGFQGNGRSLYIPLPADKPDQKAELKVVPVESNIQDLSFEKYKKDNRSEIALAHRTPLNKLGIYEGMSVAASLDASKTFKEQVSQPEQRMLAKKLNKIIKEFTDVFVLEFNELSLTDEDTQSKIDERYLRMQVITPNMVLTRLGHPGRKGGDKPVELKPQAAAEQRATAGRTRQEDSDRSAATSTTAAEGRNPQGEGRRE